MVAFPEVHMWICVLGQRADVWLFVEEVGRTSRFGCVPPLALRSARI
jgi:hypothetical protein